MRVSDVAYEKIKMMIITARLRPGQTLVEAELMEELGMGRTPTIHRSARRKEAHAAHTMVDGTTPNSPGCPLV